jgi:hypothetical protein
MFITFTAAAIGIMISEGIPTFHIVSAVAISAVNHGNYPLFLFFCRP